METRQIKIADLKQHPLQQAVYGDLSAREFESLKADIAKAGLLQPPEVSVDLVIIDGHQRIKACQELGIEEIKVLVRQDLNQHDVDIRFCKANLDRRQLGPVEKARVYKAIFEAEYRSKRRRLHPETDSNFRNFISEHLQISEKTVERHLRLLRLPRAIQDAVSSGKLGMIKALEVAKLSESKKEELKLRLARGENAVNVVKEYIAKPAKTYSYQDHFERLLDLLGDNVSQFEANQLELAEVLSRSERMTSLVDRSCDLFVQLHGLAVDLSCSKHKRDAKVKEPQQQQT